MSPGVSTSRSAVGCGVARTCDGVSDGESSELAIVGSGVVEVGSEVGASVGLPEVGDGVDVVGD